MALTICLVITAVIGSVAVPAWACGCGAYIPDRPGAAVNSERSLISYDGIAETIVMELGVRGLSKNAAWVMPVPSEAEVTLGDARIFGKLEDIGRPRTEHRDLWGPNFDWMTGASDGVGGAPRSGAPPVEVRERTTIGPFEVARLAAEDPGPLHEWLTDNGYTPPARLQENLAPYIARQWEIVAIKLMPARKGDVVGGTLPPIGLRFRTDQVVYPMRLSRTASLEQSVSLYMLAEHRMDPTTTPVKGSSARLAFAGPVDAATGGKELRPYLSGGASGGGERFLTIWRQTFGDPSDISGDYVFTQASRDEAFREVIYIDRDHGGVTGAVLLVLVVVLAGAGVASFAIRKSRRRNTPTSPQ